MELLWAYTVVVHVMFWKDNCLHPFTTLARLIRKVEVGGIYN